MKNYRFAVNRNITARCVEIFYYQEHEDGSFSSISDLVMKKVEVGMVFPSTPLRPSPEEAQELMNELWAVGLRPSDIESPVGTIKAQQAHIESLKEMSSIVIALALR